MVAFLLALLASAGFVRIAVVVIAVVALGACTAAALLVVERYARDVVGLARVVAGRVRPVGSSVASATSRGVSQVTEHGRAGARRAGALSASAAAATARGSSRIARSGSHATVAARQRGIARLPALRERRLRVQAAAARQLAGVSTQTQRHVRVAADGVRARRDAWAVRNPVAKQKDALRANAKGAQLRRDGAYLEAAEQHRVALALFRELGDRRSEALTLNNLALALDRAGDSGALDLFEEAAAILGELGEEQQEGEVIANLALAFRRRGSDERSAEVLELALEKLNPESQAYQKVEGLRHAS